MNIKIRLLSILCALSMLIACPCFAYADQTQDSSSSAEVAQTANEASSDGEEADDDAPLRFELFEQLKESTAGKVILGIVFVTGVGMIIYGINGMKKSR